MVKVGNSECGFLKLTPLSRISAIAGAVSGVTFNARKSVRHEQDQVVGRGILRERRPADNSARPADRTDDGAAHENLPED